MSSLSTAYLNADPRLAPFFAHRPGDWTSAIEARHRLPAQPLSGAAIEEIAHANARWGVAPRVTDRVTLLSSPDARVIATGQQTGLLGGPLYTLYKAIAAVRLAEQIEHDHHISVIPIFWVASEDDDFNEVRSLRWQNSEGTWQRYDYDVTGRRPGTPIYDIPVTADLRSCLSEIFAGVRQTEFTAETAARTNEFAAAARDLEEFFIRTLTWLLGDRSPLFLSPRMTWIRRGAASIIERELAEPGQSSRLVIEAAERLRALGFAPQLHRRPEHVNCFLHRDGVRHKILSSAGGFETIAPAGERQKVAADVLRARLADDPAPFGLNVVTRPITQDHLLPTLAYVAGPGEVAYFAQLRGVYERFGVAMPMIFPRPQVCLIEPRVERALAKLDVTIESVASIAAEQFDSMIRQATQPSAIAEHLDAAQHRLNDALEFVGSRVDLSEPAVARSFEKLKDNVKTAFEKLAERQRDAALSRDSETTRAVSTVRDSLWPDGLSQERALTVFFPFLNLFGTRLIARLGDAIALDARNVQPIALSSLMTGEATS
jgi:bacillithiol biosynthesis cysteine-adding enzyme BshC